MSYYDFPNQRIPEKDKNEQWHINHVIGYVNYSSSARINSLNNELIELYYAASAKLSPKQEEVCKKMITERFGQNFGPKYEVYPLIEKTIENIIGKYRQRPLKRRLMVNNEKAIIKKLEAKVDMLFEEEIRKANEEIAPDLGFTPESPKPEMKIPENVEEYFSKDFRTVSEEIGETILYQSLIVKKEKEKLYDALRHFLISGRTFIVNETKNNHPSFAVPHVLDTDFDWNRNESIQSDMHYFVYSKFMTLNEIMNTFNISKKKIEELESYNRSSLNTSDYSNWFRHEGDTIRMRVVFMKWISIRKSKFKKIINKESGIEEYKIIDDFEKTRNRDEIVEIEHDDIRHCFMAGPATVISYGRDSIQLKTVAEPKKRFINAVGLVDKSTLNTNEVRSLAKKLLFLQEFASEILYEIRLNARQLDGSVLVIDASSIPKEWLSLGFDKALQKVNFHLKRDRIQVTNTKDKRSNSYASSANVSQKGRLAELVNFLGLIEDLAEKISGDSKEGKGEANPYQKATTTEVNLNAISARMEEYFGIFDSFVETALERFIYYSKQVYKPGQIFNYFGGDQESKFLKIMPDFLEEDLGCHIADNRKEFERKQRIDQIAGQTFANSQDPQLLKDLIKLLNADTSTESEAIFDRSLSVLMKMREENNKIAQQQHQDKIQIDNEKIIKDESKHKDQMQNNLDVAHIYANSKADEVREKEVNNNLRKAAELEKEKEEKNKKEV